MIASWSQQLSRFVAYAFHHRPLRVLLPICSIVVLIDFGLASDSLQTNLLGLQVLRSYQQQVAGPLGPKCGKGGDDLQGLDNSNQALSAIHSSDSAIRQLWLGRLWWEDGRCEDSVNIWTLAADGHGEAARMARFELARALYAKREHARSVDLFRQVGGEHFLSQAAYRELSKGNVDSALALFAFSLEANPSSEAARGFSDAADRVISGVYGNQDRIWRQLVTEIPDNQSTYWRASGELALAAGDPSSGAKAFQRGIELPGDSYHLYVALARALAKLNDLDGAAGAYKRAVDSNPKRSLDPYLRAADIELQLGSYESAVRWYERARQFFPDSEWPDLAQGMSLFRIGRFTEAESFFLSAHAKNPRTEYPLYYLAVTKRELAEWGEAAEYMEMAIGASSTPPCAWFGYAQDWYDLAGSVSKATELRQRRTAYCRDNSNKEPGA